MAAKCTSLLKVLQRVTNLLKSSACEWLLIFLLLIDAALSYLLTKFAHYCKLQVPCILCSRLDHVLGNEKPGFYLNLLCNNHRSEISYLISCHIHGKLAYSHAMCEECLLSYTAKTKSNLDVHRLLLAKFEVDHGYGFQALLLNRELVPGSVGVKLCSCCNKPLRSRQSASRILQLKTPRSGMTNPNIPLPRRLTQRESLKKMRERFSGPVPSPRAVKCGYDSLPHVGYTELKITSDTESEFPFSDDEVFNSIVHDIKEPKEESKIQHDSEVPPKAVVNLTAPETLKRCSAKPCLQPDISNHLDMRCLVSDADTRHDMGKPNQQQREQGTHPCALPELISLDYFPSPSNVVDAHVAVSTNKLELEFPLHQISNPSALSELMSLVDAPLSVNAVEDSVEASQIKLDGYETSDTRNISIKKHEVLNVATETTVSGINSDQVADELPPINPTHVDLRYVRKPTVLSIEREGPDFTVETPPAKETDMVPAENASAQDIGLSSHDSLPSTHHRGYEFNTIDASRSKGVQMVMDSVWTERTELSGLESLDRSFVSETECESVVDRLKRQVEYDRRYIRSLYEELEEERSSSAIAANQAMAMITRLQEEKAALHMEALQYLRMMEEQAEYDVEALEKANDLLAEKEKEIQDLEAELELFKLRLPDESVVQTIPEGTYNLDGKSTTLEITSICYAKEDADIPSVAFPREVSNDSEKAVVKSSWSDYEDEKLFISQCLKGLQRKLHEFSHHGALPYMSDSDCYEETSEGAVNKGESLCKKGARVNGEMKENNFLIQKDIQVSNENVADHLMSNASIRRDHIVRDQNNKLISNVYNASKQHKDGDLATFESEISDLNERLKAVECDINFLENTFSSLQNGKEGVQLVQEIVHHLQELRKIGMRNKCQSVT